MADKIIKGLSIQIGADTIGLDKALKDVEEKSRSASSELRSINAAVKTVGDSAVLWRQKQELLTKAIESSREKVKILEDAQKGFAERFKNGEIDQGAYDKFRDKLTKAKDKLKELKSQQEETEAKFKSGEIDQGKYEKFCKSVENAEKKVRELETAEHSMEENLRLGNISEEQYHAFQRELEYAHAAVEKYENGLKEANEKVEKLGSESSDTADDVKELGEKADSTASGGISAMTVALGNLVADGIKKAGSELKDFTKDVIQTGMDFEAAMSNVGAISGASSADLESLTAKAEEMGATTKFTAKESADAFQYMAMAGWKTEDMLGGIEGIMSLAAASGEDLATTSDIVTDALTAFGLTAEDSGHFADVLAAASSNANTNVSMMGETFKYVAPIAGALNFSVEDTAEAIGLMANSGIKASQAGTSLRAILTAMTDTSEKAYSAFQELGVETINADGSMRGLNEILGDLRTSWQGLTEAEQADYAQRIAGKEAMSGFLSLVNAAPGDIDKLSGSIRDCDGAASDMSATMVDNLQGDMTILGSAVDGMKISLSEKLNPALRDVAQYVTSKMPEIEKVLEKAGSKAIKFLDFSVKNLPKAVDFLKKSTPVIKGIGAALIAWKITEKVKPGTDAVKKFFSSVKSGNSVMEVFNSTLKANPFGAVAATVGLVTTAIGIFKDKFKEAHDDTDKFIEEQEEYQRQCRESIDHIKDLKKAADENAVKVDVEYDDIRQKWDELQKLVDQNGKIKQGYEERVKYIANELTEATGVEIELVDGQIQKYSELKSTIEETIEKQRAQRLFEAYSANEAELYQAQTDAKKEYFDTKQIYDEKSQELSDANYDYEKKLRDQWEISKNRKEWENTDFDEYKEYIQPLLLTGNGNFADEVGLREAFGNKMLAQSHKDEAKQSLDAATKKFQKSTEELDWLMRAENLIADGEFEKASRLLTEHNDQYKKVIADKNATDDERRKAYNDTLEKMNSDLDLANKAAENGCKESSKKQMQTVADALAENVEASLDSGLKSGDVFGRSFKDTCKRLLDQGVDLSELERLMKERGYNLGDTLGVFLRNGFESQIGTFGESVGNAIDGIVGTIQDALNSSLSYGPQPEISFKIPNMFNEIFDNIPFFAAGGFLGSGQGIVAEAGPELIEIMNGGAKITPLTGSARNTPVTSGNSGRNICINNTINAKISGSYDVRRLAEDLACEQRRIERNMGL